MGYSERESLKITAMKGVRSRSIPFWIWRTDAFGKILECHGVPESFQEDWNGILNH